MVVCTCEKMNDTHVLIKMRLHVPIYPLTHTQKLPRRKNANQKREERERESGVTKES